MNIKQHINAIAISALALAVSGLFVAGALHSKPAQAMPATPAACVGMTFDRTVDMSAGGTFASGSIGSRYLVFIGHSGAVSIGVSGASCIDDVDGSRVTIGASVLSHGDVCVLNGGLAATIGCDHIVP